jgi:hypothetical protein
MTFAEAMQILTEERGKVRVTTWEEGKYLVKSGNQILDNEGNDYYQLCNATHCDWEEHKEFIPPESIYFSLGTDDEVFDEVGIILNEHITFNEQHKSKIFRTPKGVTYQVNYSIKCSTQRLK